MRLTPFKRLPILILSLLSTVVFSQTIIYVDADATGADDGTTWVSAYNDLQDALTTASINTPAQIWIAEGTYKPGTTRVTSFAMIDQVEIYGGFAGNETALSQRDYNIHRSILSGEIGTSANTDNVENVIRNSGIGITAVLDGVEITRGGYLNVSAYQDGAGMYNDNASPTIRNCKFYDNHGGWGGAVYNHQSNPTFSSCHFSSNTAQERGGAIYHSSISGRNDLLTVVNSVFSNNAVISNFTSGRGAALMNATGTNMSLYNNTFSGNACANCTSAEGAVIRLSGSLVQMVGNIIWGNNTQGAIYDVAINSVIANNIIEGGFSTGTDIINQDPLFEDAANENFRISYCSPAIDRGVFGVISSYPEDFGGSDREVGLTVDMGAYEYSSGVLLNTKFNPSCPGGSDGSISFTTEGASSFELSVDGVTFQSSTTFSGLSATQDTIHIKETSTGCIQKFPYTISDPSFSITSTATNITCSNSSTAINTFASGGVAPLSYSLDGFTYQSGGSFSNVTIGQNVVYVKDANDCVDTDTVSVKILSEWIGNTTDWHTASNWCTGSVPDKHTSATMHFTSFLPTEISSDASVYDLIMPLGSSIKVNSGGGLAIYGSLTSSDPFNAQKNIRVGGSYNLLGSPMVGINIADLGVDFLYEWDGTAFVSASGTMQAGKGYFVASNASNPTISLFGTPNTGQVSTSISTAGDAFNILANPYLAAIDRASFVAANTGSIDGNIWLWNDGGSNVGANRGGDYILINNLGVASTIDLGDGVSGSKSLPSTNTPITSFQGFLVSATVNANVTFEPTMQTSAAGSNGDGNFYRKTSDEKTTVKLSLSNADNYNETLIGLVEGATLGHDYALDGAYRSVNPDFAFYSKMGEQKMAIQALPTNQELPELPLGIELRTAGNYRLQVEEMVNLKGVGVSLKNNLTGEVIALSDHSELALALTAGKNNQYSLVFEPTEVLGIESIAGLRVSGSTERLIVKTDITGTHRARIFDLSGRNYYDETVTFADGTAELLTSLRAQRVYIIKVQDQSLKFIIK